MPCSPSLPWSPPSPRPRHPPSRSTAGNIDLNEFRPAIDSRGYLTVNASQVLGKNELSFGLGALDWGHGMLDFKSGGNEYAIKDVIAATLIAAYGFKVGPAELELGMSAPFVIMSGDRNPDNLGDPNDPNDDKLFKLSGQGFGNVGIHIKTRFLKTSKGPRIGLGLIASAYLPTVSPKDKWLGESAPGAPADLLILDKEFGREHPLRLALNGGIRIRTQKETFADNPVPTARRPPTGDTIEAGTDIPVGFGIAYAVSPQKFDLVGEVTGAIPLKATNYFPVEALAGIKVYLARNSFLSIGGGAGLQPNKGGSPDARAFIGIVFEPNIGDRDGDGLKDDVDACPDRARGLRRLRGRGRLPRSRQRPRRHPRRRRQVPERARDQERLPGRGRLPRRRQERPRRRRHPRRRRPVPGRPRGLRRLPGRRTAAPTPTTTRTASPTSTTCARTSPRTRTASRTRTAAPIPTTTRTASSTSTTSARTSPRPTTGSRTRTAARIADASW